MYLDQSYHIPLSRRADANPRCLDCSTHYASWQAEFPSAADRFRPGGFGENLVLARMNERNV